jgi:DNA (cytosine-5)-methyltransferase 1
VKPRVICLENVEEFAEWGPLLADGNPDPMRKSLTFRIWVGKIRAAGYEVQWRELRACDYGAPTTRKRLFVIARSDGLPIVWPSPTHGPGRIPYRTAAECMDWSLECPSIFGRERPLAEATLRRIARGMRRYVLEARDPFVVSGLVAPTLIQQSWGERKGQAPRCLDIQAPLGTVVGGGIKHALVAAFLARHYGGHENDGAPLQMAIPTITAKDHHALVTAQLGHGSRAAEVRAFLLAYYGTDQDPQLRMPLHTVTTKDRFGLVTIHGQAYEVADIGMRMLAPRELYRAQGFPDSYQIAPEYQGAPLTKTAQVRMAGNSVCPPIAAAIVRAQFAEPVRASEVA